MTDEWVDRGVKPGKEFAILTDEITRAWSGMSTRQYKNYKGLKKENITSQNAIEMNKAVVEMIETSSHLK